MIIIKQGDVIELTKLDSFSKSFQRSVIRRAHVCDELEREGATCETSSWGRHPSWRSHRVGLRLKCWCR